MADERQTTVAKVNDLHTLSRFVFNPEPMYVYKPRRSGDGAALKVNLRLAPEMAEDGSFVKDVQGGLFLDLAAQTGMIERNGRQFPKFAWQEDDKRITAKLCLPDILGLLVGIRTVRERGKPLPASLQPQNEADPAKAARTMSLFHKFGNSSTAINYTFEKESSILRLSKSRDVFRSISISLTEELQFQRYLDLALDAFTRLGMR